MLSRSSTFDMYYVSYMKLDLRAPIQKGKILCANPVKNQNCTDNAAVAYVNVSDTAYASKVKSP